MENTLNHGWKMNLQLFAEDGGEGGAQETGQNEQSGSEQSGSEQNGAKTYSAEEVVRLIQSETDKRVTQALNKQKREYEKKLSLSGLGEQERAMAEKDQQITDLQEQVAELTQFRTRQAVMTELSARGIAPELADLIALTEDEEPTGHAGNGVSRRGGSRRQGTADGRHSKPWNCACGDDEGCFPENVPRAATGAHFSACSKSQLSLNY